MCSAWDKTFSCIVAQFLSNENQNHPLADLLQRGARWISGRVLDLR